MNALRFAQQFAVFGLGVAVALSSARTTVVPNPKDQKAGHTGPVHTGGLVPLTGALPPGGSHRAFNPVIGGVPSRGTETTGSIDGNSIAPIHPGGQQP